MANISLVNAGLKTATLRPASRSQAANGKPGPVPLVCYTANIFNRPRSCGRRRTTGSPAKIAPF
jgi:hypothetical protein